MGFSSQVKLYEANAKTDFIGLVGFKDSNSKEAVSLVPDTL